MISDNCKNLEAHILSDTEFLQIYFCKIIFILAFEVDWLYIIW